MSCKPFLTEAFLVPAARKSDEGGSIELLMLLYRLEVERRGGDAMSDELIKAMAAIELLMLLHCLQVERRGRDVISDEPQAFLTEEFLMPAAREEPSRLTKAMRPIELLILLHCLQVDRRGSDAISR